MRKSSTKKPRILKKIAASVESCHGTEPSLSGSHPDHSKQIARINRINGQMEAVKRMITEQKYCPDILIQIRAVHSAVKSLEASILEKHLKSCVMDAMRSKSSKEADKKIQELMDLFTRN